MIKKMPQLNPMRMQFSNEPIPNMTAYLKEVWHIQEPQVHEFICYDDQSIKKSEVRGPFLTPDFELFFLLFFKGGDTEWAFWP